MRKLPATRDSSDQADATRSETASLKSDISQNLHAETAATKLLLNANVYIQSGEPLPDELRSLMDDCLTHLADSNPLEAFRWLLPEAARGRGRVHRENTREWLEIARAIHIAHNEEGLPLYRNGTSDLRGSAFEAVARKLLCVRDEAMAKEADRLGDRWKKHAIARQWRPVTSEAIAKEARRLKERWVKHMKGLPDDARESLGHARRNKS